MKITLIDISEKDNVHKFEISDRFEINDRIVTRKVHFDKNEGLYIVYKGKKYFMWEIFHKETRGRI